MCLAVYIASDIALREIKWNKAAPAFYLEAVERKDKVRRRFTLRHVYYAGSHQCCGCGFLKEDEAGPAELEKSQADYNALSEVIKGALAQGGRAEFFTCMHGGERAEPESSESVTPRQLRARSFKFKELQFFRVEPDA